ncbi:MAG: epoxyqueuosine reductase, partial [Rhizobiaceae bacterium]
YQIDARRCISYLTIESREPVPLEFRKSMGNRIYGCDDCLAVCPWNKFAQQASEARLSAPSDTKPTELQAFLKMDDAQFRARFSGSPVKRIGRDRFVRNCLIAAGNSGVSKLIPLVQHLRNDSNEVVREAADWAMSELTGDET